MSYFAQLDPNNLVLQVISAEQDFIDTGLVGDPASWYQTSYNTKGGVYYIPNTNTPDPDQTKAFRKNYAGIGFSFLQYGPEGEGFVPPRPYPSWTMNSFSYMWDAPVPYPAGPQLYYWDEETLSWVLDPIQPSNAPSTTNDGAPPSVIG